MAASDADAHLCPAASPAQVKYVCKMVGQRSATLMGAAIAALIRHMGRDMPSTHLSSDGHISETAGEIPMTIVAADGSLILKYDKFRCAGGALLRFLMARGVCSIKTCSQ
jgi:hexokinase